MMRSKIKTLNRFMSVLLVFAIILSNVQVVFADVAPEIQASLLARYPLLEDVKDASGKGQDATAVGNITYEDGLTLPGGTKSNPNYVQLPTGLFDNQDNVTISVWIKSNTNAGNYSALFFGTPANSSRLPENYWLFNPTNPQSKFKSVFTNSVSSSAPWGTEVGVTSVATTGYKGVWTNYTTVISSTSITGYVNGVNVGTTSKTRKTSDFGAGLNAYLGRSNYLDDNTFAGSFKDLRIYGTNLTDGQVAAVYADSQEDLQLNEAKNALTLSNTQNLVSNISLPATGINGTTISWSSSNAAAVSDSGNVTLAATQQTAVLTATISLNTKTITKQFTVTTAAQGSVMDFVADELKVPYITTPGAILPTTVGSATVAWSSSNTSVIDANGNILAPSSGISDDVGLTATITLDGQVRTKTFTVKVIESSPNYILSYIRSGNTNMTNSMHLAYSADGQTFTALNNNTGVLFAKGDVSDITVPGTTYSLTNPYIFRMKDLSFGVVATRPGSAGKVLLFTSNNLTSYKEVGLLSLNTTKIVNNPVCEYDSSLGKYVISWVSEDGTAYYNTTDDFTVISDPVVCQKVDKPSITTGITNAVPSNIIPVTKAEGEVIKNKLSQVVNTGVNNVEVTTSVGTPVTIDQLGKATLTYSDGTTVQKAVTWNQSDFDKINFSQQGIYTVNGTIKQTSYPFPMISNSADPNVIKYNGKYYYIATNEAGQKTLDVRVADTISGLASAQSNTIFTANASGDASGCIWAPEFHEINGELYIFVAAGSPTWNTVQSRVMKLKTGGNPTVASDWGSMQKVLNKAGGDLYTNGITLDMTYFEDAGKSYVIWAQRYIGSTTGPSQLYIAEVNASEPWKLISDPVLISSPDYAWDRNNAEVDEGPFVLKHNGKLFVTFSGAYTDNTYCVGLLTATEGTDLLNRDSWEKTNYPILTSESVSGQYGPGHNSFTVDEDGNDVLIFHARPSSGSRHMSARRVHWAADGTPVLSMTDQREIANTSISATITVKGDLQGDDLKLQSALNNIIIPDANNLKSNITLPVTGQFGTSLSWTSSNEAVISTKAKSNTGYADTPAGYVTRQDTDTVATLTVTASLNGKTASKTITATVKAKETAQKEYAGYLYAYFSGDTSRMDDQQIYFALSKDGVTWSDLNQNNPVLTSALGDKGVRDPYIIRSADGGKFYLIATDLDIRSSKYGSQDWGKMSTQGSTSLMIWESTDLVNWSNQRMVDVASSVGAGAAWAPEAIYDEVTGEYLVYWSSRVSTDSFAKNRIYVAKTRDFVTFTKPEVYVDADTAVIDASMFKEGNTYYRLIKNENSGSVYLSSSNKLLDYSNQTALGNSFTKISNTELEGYTGGYEGPTMFKFNNQNKWCVLVDEYVSSKRGYIPFVSSDISAENSLHLLTNGQYLMPTGAKHGTVIPVTQQEYDSLTAKWSVAAPNETQQTDPVLSYDFNETLSSNKTIQDKSGNNHTGTLSGNATYAQDSEKGQVLYLDGTSNTFAALPQGFFDGRDVMSISMDIKPEMTSDNFFTFAIGQNTSKYMFLNTRQARIRNAITTQSYSKEQEVLTTGSFLDKWVNVKLIMQGHQMSMYVNGTLAGTNNYVRSINDLGTNLLAYLGKSLYTGDPYFKGYFDNIKVYNRALSQVEITGIVPGSKDELAQLVTQYAGKNAANYTADSFAVFQTAYTAAQQVAAKASPTAEELQTAINDLKTAVANLVVYQGGVLLHYEFNGNPSDGTVIDSSECANNGTVKGSGASIKDGALTLPGTAYVELPKGMFDGRDTLTISTWLKNETGKGNYAAMFFGTTESNPSQYWLFNPCNPSGLFKSVITNGLNTSAPWSTEYGISPTNAGQGIAGPATDSNWAFYTTVIEPGKITAYYNGVKVGTVSTSRTVSQLGTDLVAYIGRSSYNDPYFKGSIRDVKVYASSLTDNEVKAENTKTLLSGDNETLKLEDSSVIGNIVLPSSGANGSTITWKSSNTAYITDNGTVTRPAAGQGNANVTMTATLSMDGVQLTKEFNIVVLENSSAGDLTYLNSVAGSFGIGITYATEDLTLPTSAKGGIAISWKSSNETLISAAGKVTRPQAGDQKATLTAELVLGQAKVEKTFEVTVAEKAYGYLLSYVVSGNTDRTDCLHLAYSQDGKSYTALNNNRGIQYTSKGSKKMGSPVIFRKADGTYGLMASDDNNSSNIIVMDSDDLLTFKNERYVQVNNLGIGVKDPSCSFDSLVNAYRINFAGSDGKSYTTTTKDFAQFTSLEQTTYTKPVVAAATLPALAVEAGEFAVTKAEYDRVIKKYSRIVNTGIEAQSIQITAGDPLKLPEKVTANYSDGSTKSMGVIWDQEQLKAVDTSKAGTYTISGTVQQTHYKNPLIEERADPYTIYDDKTGYYYFTASYPVRGDSDPEGYDRVVIRRAKTIEGLADAEEITLWDEANSDACFRYIWAPEIHNIDGKWYILYTASRSSNVWDIRPHVLACEGDGDPYKPGNWKEKGQVKPAADDTFSFSGFSLDMTYFTSNGKHYLAWAQIGGDPSSIYLATIDPTAPWQLTSKPIQLTTPQLAWEWKNSTKVNEGPAVLKHNGKVYLFYSAAAVDESYSVGLMSADETSDLMNKSSWTKNAYPLLTSDDLPGEYGPGHNSFTVDAYGNVVIVYHARPIECLNNTCEFASSSDLNDPHRHARVKNVNFAADGAPVLNMTYGEELADAYKTVNVTVTVKANDTTTPQAVTGVKLDKDKMSLTVGESGQLTPTVEPLNAANQNVSWSSSDTHIATVDSNGKVSAIAAGTATITVKTAEGGKTAECIVKVNDATTPQAVTGVKLDKDKMSLTAGQSGQLTPTVEPLNANQNVSWSSSDTRIATVDSNGKVSAIAAGTATITVITAEGGKTAACIVTVSSTSSSSSDSGSSNSNKTQTTPPAPVTTTDIVTKDGVVIATTASKATIDKNGIAVAVFDNKNLKEAVEKAAEAAKKQGEASVAQVELKVEAAANANANAISATIPKESLVSLVEKGIDTLKVSTPRVIVSFDNIALEEINKKAQGDVTVNVASLDKTKVSEKDKAAIGDRPVYELSISSGNSTITSFGDGLAYVSIPYTLKAGESADNIVIYYIDGNGKLNMVSHCKYDSATKTANFITKHFSTYAVAYSKVEFTDVNGWYADSVKFLAARGVIGGNGNGKYTPDAKITRAEIVSILAKLSGADLSKYTGSSFSDVKANAWYSAAVQWAYENKIVTGSNGKFDPNTGITRQDLAVILAKYVKVIEKQTLAAKNAEVKFTDSSNISSYAKSAVATMQQAGIIAGTDNNMFAPKVNTTRAEAASMIAKLLKEIVK